MPDNAGPADYSDWKPRPLPAPWVIVPVAERPSLEAELQAELAPGHLLSGEIITAVARCPGCDEMVFIVEGDHPTWFALVRLTWRQYREQLPLPATELLRRPMADSLRAHAH